MTSRRLMTPAQLDRAKQLRDFLRRLPTIKKWNGQKGTERSGLTLQVSGEHPYIHTTDMDKQCGRKVITFAERLVSAELRKLGVRVPRYRKRKRK